MDEFRRNDLAVGITRLLAGAETEQAMLDQLKVRMEEAGMTNIEPVLGDEDDPNLPAGEIDSILYGELASAADVSLAPGADQPGGRGVDHVYAFVRESRLE